MKEIEFRGIDKDSNKFLYGGFLKHQKSSPSIGHIESEEDYQYIIFKSGFSDWNLPKPIDGYEVMAETVGQYTGLKDKNGVKIFHNDIIKVESKHGFNSELMHEFKDLKGLDSLNSIGLHFIGIVKIDLFRGIMFENPKNGYQEPIFTRHIDIKINHGGIEVIGNIHQNPELLL